MISAFSTTIEAVLPEIIALRRELHSHPEIRFEERWTSERIARFLDETGIPYRRGYAKGNGIVASVEGAKGKTVALRADIDALEIQEQTGLPYASSIPNRMHACGHDGHTAILCGVAKILAQHRGQLPGAVRLLFQPGEEIAAGARYMVREGAVDGVDAIFALHGWPGLPLGRFGVKDGPMMASASDFTITVCGKGCHAADPGAGVDPILAAAHITAALQTIVSRELNPWDAGVVTVAQFHAGNATNIIPETAVLAGTFRSLDPAVHHTLQEAIRRIASETARAFRASADVEFASQPYPPVINDPAMTTVLRAAIAAEFGDDAVVEVPRPCMAAEDFAFYLREVPGAFVWLGLNGGLAEPYPALHNPQFDFNDEAIPLAMRLLTRVAVEFLESHRAALSDV